jgi:tetratricopeptide (TPR) repeat protein
VSNHRHSRAKPDESTDYEGTPSLIERALGCHQQGWLTEAEGLYRQILAHTPLHFDALHLLGVIEHQKGHHAAAEPLIERAIDINPDVAAAHSNLGLVLRSLKRSGAALASYDRAIGFKPDYADAFNNRGNALLELRRLDEALASYDRAIGFKPDHADAFNNRGNALRELKRLNEALVSYDRAIALKPDHADAFNNRGNALRELKRPAEALASYDRAIALKPDYADAFSHRGNALHELRRFDEALASYDCAIALKPDHADAFNNRGIALQRVKRLHEALASYDRAIALKPDYADAFKNRGMARLLEGDYRTGWVDYEWRKRLPRPIALRTYLQPVWLGDQDIAGKRLLVYWEQGLGDTIQFCRYLRLAEAKGAKVIFSPQTSLMRLLRGLSPTLDILDSESTPAQFDYHIPLLSMPLAFKTDLHTIPADMPYLQAEPDRIKEWKARLGDRGLKVGIAWWGSKLGTDIGKSFHMRLLHSISNLPGVRLISLQKGEGAEQLEDLPRGMNVETLGDEFDSGPDGFLDSAAVMENLDLIITTDTSVAHLAGALARPTWVALKSVPDWRWMLDRSDSPWYPTMRLFRQTTDGDWRGVFANVETQLRPLLDGPLLDGPLLDGTCPEASASRVTRLQKTAERLSFAPAGGRKAG